MSKNAGVPSRGKATQSPNLSRWPNYALTLLAIQCAMVCYAAQIFWSTKDAVDFSGLTVIYPIFGLLVLSLPTIIVSVIALKKSWNVIGWFKKLLITLGIVINVLVLCSFGVGWVKEALYPPQVQLEPISLLSSTYLV